MYGRLLPRCNFRIIKPALRDRHHQPPHACSLMVVVVPARAQHAYDMATRREFVRFGGHTSATTRLCALCEKFIFIRLSS